MKNILYLIAFMLISICSYTQSAISINVNDIADADEDFIISLPGLLDTYDYTTTGADVTWDFSGLTATTQDTVRWVNDTETNVAYFLLWFASNVAEETGQAISNDFFSMEDIFNFYDRSTDQLALTGIAGTISGIPLPAAFDDPDIVYEFPLEYGDMFSSESGYSFDIPTLGTWTEHRIRTNTVDGWGNIKTPYGEFDALRVKSVIQIDDTITYSGIDVPFSYITNEYKWLAKEMGIPVLQITTQELFGTETVSNISYRDSAHVITSVENSIFSNSIHAYPNPSHDIVNLELDLDQAASFSFELVDVSGKLIYKSVDYNFAVGFNSIELPVKNYDPGIYIIKYYVDDKSYGFKKLLISN